MTDNRDPRLQKLFADTQEDLADNGFTARTMLEVDRLKRTFMIRRVCVGLLLIVCAWFAANPLQQVAVALTRGLSQPLIPLGDGLFAGLASPANTYAGALVLILLSLRVVYRRLFSSSY